MMTFVFSWGKTNIQEEFRQSEIDKLDQETMDSMIADVDKVISDYKVTSAERYKRINNEMLMLGQCDSDSHTPHCWSMSAASQLIRKEIFTARRSSSRTRRSRRRPHGSHGTNPTSKDGSTLAIKDGRIMAEVMEANPTAATAGTRRNDEILLLQSTLRSSTRSRHYEFQLILLHIKNMPASDQ